MRMSAERMREVAEMYPAQSITKIAKTLEMYSLTDNVSICRRAVIRAIRWARSDASRCKLKSRGLI